jgi:hypothetical protein
MVIPVIRRVMVIPADMQVTAVLNGSMCSITMTCLQVLRIERIIPVTCLCVSCQQCSSIMAFLLVGTIGQGTMPLAGLA